MNIFSRAFSLLSAEKQAQAVLDNMVQLDGARVDYLYPHATNAGNVYPHSCAITHYGTVLVEFSLPDKENFDKGCMCPDCQSRRW